MKFIPHCRKEQLQQHNNWTSVMFAFARDVGVEMSDSASLEVVATLLLDYMKTPSAPLL